MVVNNDIAIDVAWPLAEYSTNKIRPYWHFFKTNFGLVVSMDDPGGSMCNCIFALVALTVPHAFPQTISKSLVNSSTSHRTPSTSTSTNHQNIAKVTHPIII